MKELIAEVQYALSTMQGALDKIQIKTDEANAYMATLQPKVEALKKIEADLEAKTDAFNELSKTFTSLTKQYETLRNKLL